MVWRAVGVALVAGTVLLSVTGSAPPAQAWPTHVSLVSCQLLAPAIDGDTLDATTTQDLDTACQQPFPVALVEEAIGDGDGSLEPGELAALESHPDNILEASCTQGTANCAMLVIAFVQDEDVTSLLSSPLAALESGTGTTVCNSEGPALGQDADCDGNVPNNGDGVVVFHLINGSGIDGTAYVVRVAQEAIEINAQLTLGLAAGVQDHDGDGVATYLDNCPEVANPAQQNTDQAPLTLADAPNDVTIPTADRYGDACDNDDDNDWLTDPYEPAFPMPVSPPGPCVPATAPTLVLNADTDGDRVRDGAECVMGYNPASANSKPPGIPAGDSDRDGLSDDTEAVVGSNALDTDSDDDGIIDGIEVRGYQSNPHHYDSDADGCPDATEIASVNADYVVNALDLVGLATRFGSTTVVMMDINKDRIINSLDLVLVARAFNPTPCG